jgi:S-DNA-T family DNA segregation ATPase FtsK/SpoIIIE
VTGSLRACFPARAACRVANKIESRAILDAEGAERLRGQGDMLFLDPGSGRPERVQVARVSDEDAERLGEHLREHGQPWLCIDSFEPWMPAPEPEIGATRQKRSDGGGSSSAAAVESKRDEREEKLYMKALRMTLRSGRPGPAPLVLRMGLDPARANRLLARMKDDGVLEREGIEWKFAADPRLMLEGLERELRGDRDDDFDSSIGAA